QRGNDEMQSFRSAGAARNHVDRGGAGAAEVFMGKIEQLLIVGVGVNRSHRAGNDAEGVLNHLGDGREAVGGTGGVRNDVMIRGVVGLVVHAKNEGGVGSVGRSGDDDFFNRAAKMLFGLGALGEEAGRFDHNVSADGSPVDFGGVFRFENLEGL